MVLLYSRCVQLFSVVYLVLTGPFSGRNGGFSIESLFRKPARLSANKTRDFTLFSYLTVVAHECVHVFFPLERENGIHLKKSQERRSLFQSVKRNSAAKAKCSTRCKENIPGKLPHNFSMIQSFLDRNLFRKPLTKADLNDSL